MTALHGRGRRSAKAAPNPYRTGEGKKKKGTLDGRSETGFQPAAPPDQIIAVSRALTCRYPISPASGDSSLPNTRHFFSGPKHSLWGGLGSYPGSPPKSSETGSNRADQMQESGRGCRQEHRKSVLASLKYSIYVLRAPVRSIIGERLGGCVYTTSSVHTGGVESHCLQIWC